jgi:hypothetical protein
MPKLLGVNIDSRSLDVSLVDSLFRSVKHIKSEKISLPENGEERSSIVTALLTKWQKEHMPAGAVFGLSLQNFSWRTIEMPQMKRPDMKRALSFELEKYLPLPMDEYTFDFIVIGSGKTTPNMVKVLVFSVRKEILSALQKIANEAGVEMLSVRCSTTDILCGVRDISGEKRLDGVFVNSSDDGYEIAGLHDSMPDYIKKVPKTVDVKEVIEELVMRFPGRVYVTGPVDPSVTGRFNSRKFQLPTPDLFAASFVKKPYIDLNFLPTEYIKQKKDYYPHIIGGLAAAVVVVFFLTGVVAYVKDRSALKRVESKISVLRSKASGVIETQKKLELLRSSRDALVSFQNKSNFSIRVLDIITETLPHDAWLINLSIDEKGKVEIEGFASKTADIVVALERSKAFKNISFSAPIISKDKQERFSLKMEVEGF